MWGELPPVGKIENDEIKSLDGYSQARLFSQLLMNYPYVTVVDSGFVEVYSVCGRNAIETFDMADPEFFTQLSAVVLELTR